MAQLKLKSMRVNNTTNILVQIPKLVFELWELKEDDMLEMLLSEDTTYLVVKKVEHNTDETVSSVDGPVQE